MTFNVSSVETTFKPTDRFFRDVYRFKISRAMILNPFIRVHPINNKLFVMSMDADGSEKDNDNLDKEPVYVWDFGKEITIDVMDYGRENLANHVSMLLSNLGTQGIEVVYNSVTERMELVNDTNKHYLFSVTTGSILLTLGWEYDVIVKSKSRVVAPLACANLYANPFVFKTLEADNQIKMWVPYMEYMRNELGPDVHIKMNNFSSLRTYTSYPGEHNGKPIEGSTSCRSIASVTLGAPGLPSKRLLTSEMGSRTPFDETITFQLVYPRNNDKMCNQRESVRASIDLMVWIK